MGSRFSRVILASLLEIVGFSGLTFKISEERLDIKWCLNVPTFFSDLCS